MAGDTGNLKQILEEFYVKRVRVPEEDTKHNVETLLDILCKFITAMKAADTLFKELFHNLFYAGSYFEGLKVNEADEFDLNIILKLPFERDDVEISWQIVYNNVRAGYAQYRLKRPLEELLSGHYKWSIFQKLSSIMEDDCLSQKKINDWWQSIADKAIQQNPQQFITVTNRARHGPTLTFTIEPYGTIILHLDLVPVVQLNEYPPTARKLSQDSTVFLVPKPIASTTNNAETKLFRISMPIVEREAVYNMGCVKMLIRIFKAIRDNENWKFFASYYIKTVFLWHLYSIYWAEDKLDEIFVEMLKQLIYVLEKRELKHFLFEEYNLISDINPVALDNMKYRLRLYLDKSQNDLSAFKELLYGIQ